MVFVSHRYLFKRGLSFIFLIFGCIGFSKVLPAATLQEALAIAYKTNPGLASAQMATKASMEVVAQASAAWRPKAQLIGAVDQEYKDTGQSDSPQNSGYNKRTGTRAGLEISQNVYSGGATEAQSQGAQADAQAKIAEYRKTEQKFLLTAIQAYLDVLKNQSVLELAFKHKDHLKKELDQGKARFELGDLTLTDVSQIEAEYAQATSEYIKAKGDLESAQAEYVALMGEMPDHLIFPVAPSFLPKDKKEALEIALRQNPEYIQSQFEEQASQTNIESALAGMRPNVNFKVALTRDSNTDSWTKKSKVYDATATASVTVPLDISGDSQSKVRKARHEASQKRLSKRSTRTRIETSVSQKIDTLEALMAQIESVSKTVEYKRIAQEGMALEEELEARTMTDRLKAETEYFKAQTELVNTRVKALLAHYDLLAELGELTVARLELPTISYSPQSYLNEVSQAPYNLSLDDGEPPLKKQKTEDNVITESLEEIGD